MSDDNGAAKFVESVIDGMVENALDVDDAVAQVLDEEQPIPEMNTMFSRGIPRPGSIFRIWARIE